MTSRVSAPQTPVGALIRGILAGAVGAVAMDLLWFYRYKRGGGESSFVDWEFSAGLDDWSKAPAPAQVGKRLFEALFQQELSPRWVALTNNVMHWIYGLAGAHCMGSLPARYGLLAFDRDSCSAP